MADPHDHHAEVYDLSWSGFAEPDLVGAGTSATAFGLATLLVRGPRFFDGRPEESDLGLRPFAHTVRVRIPVPVSGCRPNLSRSSDA
ncbi:hypothetical protein APR12_001301 [Nocardia amikacinitolerans]|nr:hypothetical protein [Nocardia amikacinitolerans]